MNKLPQPIANFVLLRAAKDNSQIKFQDGTVLWLDTSYSEGRHANILCEVLAVPKRLTFDKIDQNSMLWLCDMDLRVGDQVIVTYLSILNAMDKKNPMNYEIDGETYFFVHYMDCMVAKRRWGYAREHGYWNMDEKEREIVTPEFEAAEGVSIEGKEIYNIICLNGYALVEPKHVQYKESKIIIPDYIQKETNKKEVVVRYVGKPNRGYLLNDVYADDACFKSGDTVIIEKNCDIVLEAQEHRTLFGGKLLWKVAIKNIEAVLIPENV